MRILTASRMRALRYAIGIGAAALIPLLAFIAGFAFHWYLTRDQIPAEAEEFRIFWEAWHILDKSFLGEDPPIVQRIYGAIRGLAQSYGDPYTVFVEPQPRQREREDLRGEFGGIGAWIIREEDGSYSLRPMPDMPAARAGIREGDILVAVDGQEITPTMSQDEVVSLIRGPVGTIVRIRVRRTNVAELLTFEIQRQRIETPSVEWRILDTPPRTGYIRLAIFTERTADELTKALDDLTKQGVNRLVLDLRHNNGGLLEAAVDVSSTFLRNGVVLYEKRAGDREKVYFVRRRPLVFDGSLVVLVDGATASAAEIVAGALQDHRRALLFGEKTFGKGSVQLVHDLSDGSSLHVTSARWLTPNHRQIDQQGLEPDVPVAVSEQDRQSGRDPVLERALEQLAAMP
ncbi:MAG: S41 family peptidase [Anaerolineae bacterium]|nr:S41 family peptidase [Anaerolineae bacterium]MDW8098018.1 S41 family peptidase [Anaerolineae bacterium]